MREAERFIAELLAQALRARRRRLGISQRGLAELSGVSKSAIARLEGGDAAAQVRSAQRALTAVGLRLAVLEADGRPWSAALDAIAGDVEHACDRSGRRLPAHLPEERVQGEPGWRISRRLARGGPRLSNDQPWTYRRHG
jgi:transcriptional regulator with XRE-family HTH domain